MSGMPARRLFYRGWAAHDHIDVELGDDPIGSQVHAAFELHRCPNCAQHLELFTSSDDAPTDPEHRVWFVHDLLLCKSCGWWQVRHRSCEGSAWPGATYAYDHHSLLDEVDIAGTDAAVEDIRAHLMQRWQDRRLIAAGKAEELIAALLREHLGCDVYATTANVNSPDGGIDLLVASDGGEILYAVQVKRRVSGDTESVHEVRNFVGALVVEGHSKGIFVTTASRFTTDAARIAQSSNLIRHRLALELVAGERLLEILGLHTPPPKITLPLSITEGQMWLGRDGRRLTTMELLFQNITW